MLDQIVVRFGLRQLVAEGAQLRLNGERLKLLGFNRHDLTDTPVTRDS